MKRQQVVDKIDAAWAEFVESFAGLSDVHMTEPGVTGEWSVKDILAHVSTWEEEALKHLPHILQGRRPPRYSVLYGGIDAFNSLMTEKKQALDLTEIRRQLAETHQKLLDAVQAIPEEEFATETRARRRIRLDTYSHYPHHTKAIREWRAQQER